MAHSILHFSAGLAVGTIGLFPVLAAKLKRYHGTKAVILARWLLLAYALGAWAVIPGIIPHLGLSGAFWSGWWMNIFVFHPLIDRLKSGGMLEGTLLFLSCAAFQYLVLLIVLRRSRMENITR